MNPELKKEVLDLMDRARVVVEAEKADEIKELMIEAYALLIRVLSDPEKLPMVIFR